MKVFLTQAFAAVVLIQGVANAQTSQVMTMPTAGSNPAPVAQTPPPSNDDTPEEIAKDAARDLKESRFYNKPGATRDQFNADWQECRLIARGSRTPSGSYTYVYNPAVISPLAAGIGGGIGAAIGQAIIEGQARRANRRQCLLIRGWRLVEPPQAEQVRLAALTDADRDAYLSKVIGADTVDGMVTTRSTFVVKPAATLNLAAPLTMPGEVWAGKKVDPAAAIELKPDEGLLVLAYRRALPEAIGRSGVIQIARYDIDKRDLIAQPRDWKKKGDLTTYSITANSVNRKAEYEVQVRRVTAGDYVVIGTGVVTPMITTSYCFGAPTFRVGAGQVVYLGDMVPVVNGRSETGVRLDSLVYANNIEDARRTLAIKQPTLAQTMTPATISNRATYGCAAMTMDRMDWPGFESLGEAARVTTAEQR
jgi:hypothetical protein